MMKSVITKKKKAELSLNIIIVAVIGLLVLVIIAVIFMQRLSGYSKGTSDCKSQGADCYSGSCPSGYASLGTAKCYDSAGEPSGEACCKNLNLG
ncbi:MAG: hypothetical protein Q8O89_05105 [Nanoarchaeota archaeon]|nr:hypothetical protein [Nanoarchaeota archaeon]